MTQIDIKLTSRSSGYIAIANNGGRNAVKSAEFLATAERAGSFEHVKFGDERYGVPSTYAIKREHIVGFQGWAYEHGLNATFSNAA